MVCLVKNLGLGVVVDVVVLLVRSLFSHVDGENENDDCLMFSTTLKNANDRFDYDDDPSSWQSLLLQSPLSLSLLLPLSSLSALKQTMLTSYMLQKCRFRSY